MYINFGYIIIHILFQLIEINELNNLCNCIFSSFETNSELNDVGTTIVKCVNENKKNNMKK